MVKTLLWVGRWVGWSDSTKAVSLYSMSSLYHGSPVPCPSVTWPPFLCPFVLCPCSVFLCLILFHGLSALFTPLSAPNDTISSSPETHGHPRYAPSL